MRRFGMFFVCCLSALVAQADAFPAEPWHQYRVVVRGNHHQHWIDGVQTVDVVDLDAKNRRLEGDGRISPARRGRQGGRKRRGRQKSRRPGSDSELARLHLLACRLPSEFGWCW
ncbi:family 16 glycoside hydrolase [Candidatus Laterigemmans baculatus]|uniref:family 16 glycoside hydrolase n=1 Tax=Candidatus Laterigemmans baculatus TaxID=2770505 RepID=UPI0013DB5B6A|nr:family 16 glycoside hydrolase [Candidatus Laterigemmans baculatus]